MAKVISKNKKIKLTTKGVEPVGKISAANLDSLNVILKEFNNLDEKEKALRQKLMLIH